MTIPSGPFRRSSTDQSALSSAPWQGSGPSQGMGRKEALARQLITLLGPDPLENTVTALRNLADELDADDKKCRPVSQGGVPPEREIPLRAPMTITIDMTDASDVVRHRAREALVKVLSDYEGVMVAVRHG